MLLAVRLRSARARKNTYLDVPDDGSGLVVHKLDADLGDATTRTWVLLETTISIILQFLTCPSEDFGDLHQLDGGLGGIHCRRFGLVVCWNRNRRCGCFLSVSAKQCDAVRGLWKISSGGWKFYEVVQRRKIGEGLFCPRISNFWWEVAPPNPLPR
jgi:hypothetical protein